MKPDATAIGMSSGPKIKDSVKMRPREPAGVLGVGSSAVLGHNFLIALNLVYHS